MAYDSLRGRLVLFGGLGPCACLLGDTWEWDGSAWTQIQVTGPGWADTHAMAFDSQRGRVVLFGGVTFADTWEYDGVSWNQVAAQGPGVHQAPGMAYDPVRGRTVLFGGSHNSVFLGDTWEWDGSVWSQVATTGPSPRSSMAMAFDPQLGKTVLHGGLTAIAPALVGSDETWTWDGTTWQQILVAGPTPRAEHRMTYDATTSRLVMFGPDSETWIGEPYVVATSTTYGTGCGTPPLSLTGVSSARPLLGTTARAAITNVPGTLAFAMLGFDRTQAGPFTLPLPLAGFGLPGCELLQSMDATLPTAPQGPGISQVQWPVPNWASLLGLRLYLQAWAPAPGSNPTGLVLSNGVDWLLGDG